LGNLRPIKKVDFIDNYSLLASFVPLSTFIKINYTEFLSTTKLTFKFCLK